MFSTIFNPNNLFFRFTDRVLDIAVLSIFWVVCSLPIITAGAASVALYYSCAKCLRYRESGTYRNYFYAFRQNFFVSTIVWLIFMVIFAILILIYSMIELSLPNVIRVMYLVLLILPLAVCCCTFPLLSRFDFNVSGLLKTGLQITARHLPRAIAVALLVFLSFMIIFYFWYGAVMLIVPGLCGLLSTYILEPVLKRYTPKPDQPVDDEMDLPWYQR